MLIIKVKDMITKADREALKRVGAKYYIEFVVDPQSSDPILNNGYYCVCRTSDDAILFDCKSRDMAIGFCYGRGIENEFAEI